VRELLLLQARARWQCAAMVLKTTTCRFSGLRIYPGRGILFVRTDGQQYLFINQKAKGLFNQRKRSAKIAWTTTYRKQHKKVRALAARAAALRVRGAEQHGQTRGAARVGCMEECRRPEPWELLERVRVVCAIARS